MITVNDSAITSGDYVGLGRPGSYAGSWYVDNFLVYTSAGDESPPQVSLPVSAAPLVGVTTLAPTVTDDMAVARTSLRRWHLPRHRYDQSVYLGLRHHDRPQRQPHFDHQGL